MKHHKISILSIRRFLLNGELVGSEGPDGVVSEVDFYRFTATPGSELVVEQKGQTSDSGTLEDPFLGWFNSGCDLQDINDDHSSLDSRLFLIVPSDGVIIIAASSCCDGEFNGSGDGIGSYELGIDFAPPSIGSISAQAIDALTGAPLAGGEPPFAYFLLAICDGDDCSMSVRCCLIRRQFLFLISSRVTRCPRKAVLAGIVCESTIIRLKEYGACLAGPGGMITTLGVNLRLLSKIKKPAEKRVF